MAQGISINYYKIFALSSASLHFSVYHSTVQCKIWVHVFGFFARFLRSSCKDRQNSFQTPIVQTLNCIFRFRFCFWVLLAHLFRLMEIYHIITLCYSTSPCPEFGLFLNPFYELLIYKNIITGDKVDMNVLTTTNLIQSIIGSLLLPSLAR